LKSNRGASSASLWPIPTPPSGGSGEQFRAEHLDYFLCPVGDYLDLLLKIISAARGTLRFFVLQRTLTRPLLRGVR
jgi:hypothetical protein